MSILGINSLENVENAGFLPFGKPCNKLEPFPLKVLDTGPASTFKHYLEMVTT